MDASAECQGFNLFGALVGTHTDGVRGAEDVNHYGAMVQSGYMVIPDKFEPFVRAEWFSMDDVGALGDQPNDVTILTFGSNWYLNKHKAKLSVDVMWALDPINPQNIDQHPIDVTDPTITGLLLDANGENDQAVLRTQFQLLF